MLSFNSLKNTVFFLGCPHINHKNICRGVSNWKELRGTRDFNTLEDMNNTIINSINRCVFTNDTLFLLGDILFGPKEKFSEFYSRINCKNIHLILGNHDAWLLRDEHFLDRQRFSSINNYLEIIIDKQFICLFHYPIVEWNNKNRGSWCVCSHSHGMLPQSTVKNNDFGKLLDVGWENFEKPLDYFELVNIMKDR